MEFGVDDGPALGGARPGVSAVLGGIRGSRARDSSRARDESLEDSLPVSPALRLVLSEATMQARRSTASEKWAPSICWRACSRPSGAAAELLRAAGLELETLRERLTQQVDAVDSAPLPPAEGIAPLDLGEPGGGVDLGRILDASANRAREGLRVVEDYVRFVLDDPGLTERLKEVRHRLPRPSGGSTRTFCSARATRAKTWARTS